MASTLQIIRLVTAGAIQGALMGYFAKKNYVDGMEQRAAVLNDKYFYGDGLSSWIFTRNAIPPLIGFFTGAFTGYCIAKAPDYLCPPPIKRKHQRRHKRRR